MKLLISGIYSGYCVKIFQSYEISKSPEIFKKNQSRFTWSNEIIQPFRRNW